MLENISGLDLLNRGTMLGTQTTKLGTDIIMAIQIIGPIALGAIIGAIYGKVKKSNSMVSQ